VTNSRTAPMSVHPGSEYRDLGADMWTRVGLRHTRLAGISVSLMENRPRRHHYDFAHRALPRLILTDWDRIRPTFQDGSAAARLGALWTGVGTRLAENDRLDLSSELVLTPIKLRRRAGFLIRFPKAAGPAEAALAVIPDISAPTRYFVLELGESPVTHQPYWVLAQWVLEGNGLGHVNMGSIGPEPAADPAAAISLMVDRVAQLLDDEGPHQ
jgi:hypothetical protein